MEATGRYELRLVSGPSAAAKACVWFSQLGQRHAVPVECSETLELCVSELLANINDHAYRGVPDDIRLVLEFDRELVRLIIEDSGPEFNPWLQVAPESPKSLADAKVGGLGIHLVRKMSSSCTYQRVGGLNHVEVTINEHVSQASPA